VFGECNADTSALIEKCAMYRQQVTEWKYDTRRGQIKPEESMTIIFGVSIWMLGYKTLG